jgi:hypothetical protein
MKVTVHEHQRLRVGMIVMLQGSEHRVEMVNPSRAHCVPLTKKKVEIKTRFDEAVKTFEKDRPGLDISPNSEIQVLRWERQHAATE